MHSSVNRFQVPIHSRIHVSRSKVCRMTQKEAEFFNRDEEKRYLVGSFSYLVPTFWVLLGQPSTGKTALVRKVLAEEGPGNKKFDALFLNPRGTEISSSKSFYRLLCDSATSAGPFWEGLGQKLTQLLSVDGKLPIGGLTIKGNDSNTFDLLNQLSSLAESIPSSRNGVLVVDEAHRLRRLAAADHKVNFTAVNLVSNSLE